MDSIGIRADSKCILCKILVSDSLLEKDFFSIETGSTSYMRECFVEGLLRKSCLRAVGARLRLNMLCWCTSEARKYSITSAQS